MGYRLFSTSGIDRKLGFNVLGTTPISHPHQLRDTFAVDLLQKGVPLEEVSKLLGHESIKTTEKIREMGSGAAGQIGFAGDSVGEDKN